MQTDRPVLGDQQSPTSLAATHAGWLLRVGPLLGTSLPENKNWQPTLSLMVQPGPDRSPRGLKSYALLWVFFLNPRDGPD